MREIKFRAYFDGEIIELTTGEAWLTMDDSGVELSMMEQYFECGSGVAVEQDRVATPENAIIVQYTGLTDKNGVEIYELHEVNNTYRVVFGDGKYVLQDISSGDIFMPLSTTTVEAYELKVTR